MSTATLLIVSASLRLHRGGRRHERTASPVVHCGRGRVSWGVANPFRSSETGTGPSASPLGGRVQSGSGAGTGSLPPAGAGVQILPQLARVGLAGLVMMVAALAGGAAHAQDAAASDTQVPIIELEQLEVRAERPVPATRIGGPPPGPCVAVDIAGHRAGHLECATDRLQAAARTAQDQSRAAIDTPVIGAGSPDVQTGLANQTATRQRMGNTFGTSVHPQRPVRPTPPPRGNRP